LFDDGRVPAFTVFEGSGLGVELIVLEGSDGLGAEFTALDGDAGREIESLLFDGVDGLGDDEKFGRAFSPFVIVDGGPGTGRFAGPGFAGAAAVAGDADVAGNAGVAGLVGVVDAGRMPGCGGRGTLRVGIAGVPGCPAFMAGREGKVALGAVMGDAGEPGLPGCDCSAFTGGFGAVDEFGAGAGFGVPDIAGDAGDPGLGGCAAFGIAPRTGCMGVADCAAAG
jgi:hypothetical protein